MPEEMQDSTKSYNTSSSGSVGFGVAPDQDAAPEKTRDAVFYTGDDVKIVSSNSDGKIVNVVKTRGGGMIYHVSLKAGGFAVTTAQDIAYAGKGAIKQPAQKTPNTVVAMKQFIGQIKGLREFIHTHFIQKSGTNVWRNLVLNELKELRTTWSQIGGSHAAEEAQIGAILNGVRTVFLKFDADKTPEREIWMLARAAIFELQRAGDLAQKILRERLMPEISFYDRRKKSRIKFDTPDDSPQLWQRTCQSLLHDALTRVQAGLSEGKQLSIADTTISDPDTIRLADGGLQVKIAQGDWQPLTPEQTDDLCAVVEVPSPRLHRAFVRYATRRGDAVPAEVLAEYPDISQQQPAVKPVASAQKLRQQIVSKDQWVTARKEAQALMQQIMSAPKLHLNDMRLGDYVVDMRGMVYEVSKLTPKGVLLRPRLINKGSSSSLRLNAQDVEVMQYRRTSASQVARLVQLSRVINSTIADTNKSAQKSLTKAQLASRIIKSLHLTHRKAGGISNAAYVLSNIHKMPAEAKAAARMLKRCQKQLSGDAGKALRTMSGQSACRLIAEIAKRGMTTGECTRWLNTEKFAPKANLSVQEMGK